MGALSCSGVGGTCTVIDCILDQPIDRAMQTLFICLARHEIPGRSCTQFARFGARGVVAGMGWCKYSSEQ